MSYNIEFIVSNEVAGERLDKVIADYCIKENLPLTRSGIKSRGIKIRVNSGEEKLSYIVKAGDKIEFEIPPPERSEIKPMEMDLEILYIDNDIAVINKPAGIVVHAGAGHKENTLVNGLLYVLGNKLSSIGGVERPGIVHRLDKDTSGIMLVALNDISHHRLVNMFKERKILKVYYAIVKGYTEEMGEINLPIGRNPSNRKKMCVNPKGKEAFTSYRTIKYLNNASLVEAIPKTGRTHQIRVHFSHIGHPILGDPIYSRDYKKYGLKGIALVAKKVSFFHPINTDKLMEFEIPLPLEIEHLIEKLSVK